MGLAWTSLPEFGTIIAMRRIQLVLASTLITLAAAAMPTKDELSKAQSVANDQMKDHIAANKNGKESNEAVGDAASDVEYRFNYILDNKGDAILCKTCNDPYGKDGEACVSPKPVGELITPEYIDGHKDPRGGMGRVPPTFRNVGRMTAESGTPDPSATSSSLCAKGIRHEHDKKTVRCRGGMCRAGAPQQNPERRIRNERDHASAASIRR